MDIIAIKTVNKSRMMYVDDLAKAMKWDDGTRLKVCRDGDALRLTRLIA